MRLRRRDTFAALLAPALPSPAPAQSTSTASKLRFEKIDFTAVIVPMKQGTVYSPDFGPTLDQRLVDFPKYPKFIVEIQASGGLSGIGESSREVPVASVRANAEWLKGKTLADLDFAKPSLGMPSGTTSDAFEIAIYDILGKHLGLPVCALLGGCHQSKVAVSYWTGQRTTKDMLEVCRKAVEGGFHNLKFKARKGENPKALLEAAVKAAPGLTYIIDFNSSYDDVAAFVKMAAPLREFPLTIEDPVTKRLDWFRQVREQTKIPVALTPSGPKQALDALRENAADVFNNSMKSRDFVNLGYLAELSGVRMWHGSGVELGVRDMWFIHKAAATKSCTIGSDTLSYLREHDLLAERFTPKNGFLEVPKAPGLGVTLDKAAVRKFKA